MTKAKHTIGSTITQNKKARHDFAIEERLEGGLVLQGWEVKSLRAGRVQLRDSYVLLKGGEAWLFGALISPLPSASDPCRTGARTQPQGPPAPPGDQSPHRGGGAKGLHRGGHRALLEEGPRQGRAGPRQGQKGPRQARGGQRTGMGPRAAARPQARRIASLQDPARRRPGRGRWGCTKSPRQGRPKRPSRSTKGRGTAHDRCFPPGLARGGPQAPPPGPSRLPRWPGLASRRSGPGTSIELHCPTAG